MKELNTINEGLRFPGKALAVTGVILVGMLVVWMIAYPLYNVWASEQTGRAELAQATYNRQIAVQEAEAHKEAAVKLAEAEVFRAEGVAKANKIIGDSLRGNEAYLRYLWITDVAGANIDKTVVYVPTEANLPLLEASRQTNG